MSNDIAKFRITIGDFQVDYEGCESFLREGIHDVIERVVDHYANHVSSVRPPEPQKHDESGHNTSIDSSLPIDSPEVDLSVTTMATRLGAKTGPELAIVAAAHLTLVQDKSRFTRHDILNNMQADTGGVYKKTFSNNLGATLQRLIGSKQLNEVADGRYALSATEKQRVESALADND